MKKSLLIIKTGHSETFTENLSSRICSLGDVFRTSLTLPLLEEYEVFWLTDQKAKPLLEQFKKVKVLTDLKDEEIIGNFDYVINLEKDINLVNLARRKEDFYGFVSINNELGIRPFLTNGNVNLKDLISNDTKTFEGKLSVILNNKDFKSDYSDFSSLLDERKNQIGFNWKVGPKWPEKALDLSFWKDLEKELAPDFKVSWQEGFDNLRTYQEWISSCETIVTLDSLGLHLALAMKKNIVALFGPTNATEINLYGRGEKFFYRTEEERSTLLSVVSNYLKTQKPIKN